MGRVCTNRLKLRIGHASNDAADLAENLALVFRCEELRPAE